MSTIPCHVSGVIADLLTVSKKQFIASLTSKFDPGSAIENNPAGTRRSPSAPLGDVPKIRDSAILCPEAHFYPMTGVAQEEHHLHQAKLRRFLCEGPWRQGLAGMFGPR
jgi:hypothetical protein